MIPINYSETWGSSACSAVPRLQPLVLPAVLLLAPINDPGQEVGWRSESCQCHSSSLPHRAPSAAGTGYGCRLPSFFHSTESLPHLKWYSSLMPSLPVVVVLFILTAALRFERLLSSSGWSSSLSARQFLFYSYFCLFLFLLTVAFRVGRALLWRRKASAPMAPRKV